MGKMKGAEPLSTWGIKKILTQQPSLHLMWCVTVGQSRIRATTYAVVCSDSTGKWADKRAHSQPTHFEVDVWSYFIQRMATERKNVHILFNVQVFFWFFFVSLSAKSLQDQSVSQGGAVPSRLTGWTRGEKLRSCFPLNNVPVER